MQQAALERQSSLWAQELLLTKQALAHVTAANKKTVKVQDHVIRHVLQEACLLRSVTALLGALHTSSA